MKMIALTNYWDGQANTIYINPEMIGHLSPAQTKEGYLQERDITRVGVLTHNNGGFNVLETIPEILRLLGIKHAHNATTRQQEDV